MRNPLRPVRLGLLWLLSGVPLESHTAAIQRIDEGHQQQLARLRRPQMVQTFEVSTLDAEVARVAAGEHRGFGRWQ